MKIQKTIFLCIAVFILCALFCGCSAICTKKCENCSGVGKRENVRLLIPEKIYAVPGVETNVYFDNVVTVINPANYAFDVDCQKGRNDLKRWRFTPGKNDVGTYKWSIRVINMDGVVAQAESELIVLPFDAGAKKKLTLFMVGASQTSAGHYADRVVDTVYDYLALVNATPNKTIFVKGYKGKTFETVDCMGNKKESGIIDADIFEIAVPMCGMTIIK